MQKRYQHAVARAILAVIGSLSVMQSHTFAATHTWDGGGADNSLATAANWNLDALPLSIDVVQFGGTTRLAPFVPATGVQYLALNFLTTATDPFTINGPVAITLGSTTAGNYLVNDSVVTQTINAPINMIGGTVQAATGDLLIGGLFNVGNGAANTVNLGGGTAAAPTNVTFGGGLTGAGMLQVGVNSGGNPTFFGTTLATGDGSTYTGNVFVNGGALRLTNANAIGTTGTVETALTSGGTGKGTLELAGADYTLAKPVTVRARSGSTINEVSLRNVENNHTISSVTTGSGGSNFNFESAAGTLTVNNFTSTVSTGNRGLRLLGGGNGQINNWTSASGSLFAVQKDGAGTWTLGGNVGGMTGNIGAVTVNGGNLVLAATTATNPNVSPNAPYGSVGGRVTGNTVINTGGTLTVQSINGTDGEIGSTLTATTVTIQSGGTLDASSFTEYSLPAAQTIVVGGTIKTGGTFKTAGNNAIYIGNSTTPSVGTLSVVGNLSVTNQSSTAAGGMRFDLGNTTTTGTSDLIQVAGNLVVDSSAGQIPLYVNPIAGALANGTYTLIQTSSGTTYNAGDFKIVGSSAGTTRQSLAVSTAQNQVNLLVSGSAARLVWKGDGSGNAWDIVTTPNWLNGSTPDTFYNFDNVTFDDSSSNQNVNLTGDLLPSSVTVNSSKNYVFQGSGNLDGAAGLTKSGTGTLTIANTAANVNTGPTVISGGTLQVGNGGAEGSLGTGAITDNSTLIYNMSIPVVVPAIAGSGNVIARGTGGTNFKNASSYTGTTTVEAGAVAYSTNGNGFGDIVAGTTVQSGGTIYFTAAQANAEPITISGNGTNGINGAIEAGGATLTTLTGPVTLAANALINVDGSATLSLTSPITGTGDLTKSGNGTLILAANSNSYSGATNVNAGTLQLGAGAVAGYLPSTSALTVTAGATLVFGSSQTVAFNRTLAGAATIAQGKAGGTTTLTGDLTGFTGILLVQHSSSVPAGPGAATSGTLAVGVPTAATVATVDDGGNGTGQGILRLTNSNALAAGAAINVLAQQLQGNGRLELGNSVSINAGPIYLSQRSLLNVNDADGFTPATVGQLTSAIKSTDGGNSLSGTITVGTGGTFAGLEAGAGSTFTFGGSIVPLSSAGSARNLVLMGAGTGLLNATVSDHTQIIDLFKIGSGKWTLNGPNAYSGRTGIAGGDLIVSAVSRSSALPASTATPPVTHYLDIMGGRVLFQYADANDDASITGQATSALTAGSALAAPFSTGQIRSSTIDATHTLGFFDDTANSRLIVGYTLPGDANVDLSVDFSDLLALARNYGSSGKTWGQGDFNYDSTVNFSDLLALAHNYDQTVTQADQTQLDTSFMADFALAQSLAPEPAALCVVGMGVLLFAGCRRRRAL